MSTASNVEELVAASSRIERGRRYSPKQGGQQHRPNSPARQNQNSGGNKNFQHGSRSPGGSHYLLGRANMKLVHTVACAFYLNENIFHAIAFHLKQIFH